MPVRRAPRLVYVLPAVVLLSAGLTFLIFWIIDRPRTGSLTFNHDVAPIIYARCASCHRPGQAAPFSLLEYSDVQKRAKQIGDVTRTRYMPPWLPEPGYGEFADSRRLTDQERKTLQQWIAAGCREGDGPKPTPPAWKDGWTLGPPDVIATMPQTYVVPAEGRDVYRNFVIPISVTSRKFVRAIELQPGNRKILHHAFIKVDATGQSRRIDAQDAEPGFPGMMTPAEMPGGHFLTWQPGKIAAPLPAGLSWVLEPGADLVLQAHLSPSGKPEQFQPSIGLYLTDAPPTNACFKMGLMSYLIDVPAGAKEHVVQTAFTLPADVDVLAVLPHAHFLAREMQGWAVLPNGAKQWLIKINNWDFNWQGDYRYATPVHLPAGTRLEMRYTYDNSDRNARNPNHPPTRVRFGARARDEMAELWLQVLPRRESDRPALAQAYETWLRQRFREADEYAVRVDPNDPKAHLALGLDLAGEGQLDAGIEHLKTAIRFQATNDEPHYHLGVIFRSQGKRAEARSAFETAIRLNPQNYRAHGNLGFMSQEDGNLTAAEASYRAALRLNPDDLLLKASLEEVLRARGNP